MVSHIDPSSENLEARIKALEVDFYKRGVAYQPPSLNITPVHVKDTIAKADDTVSSLTSTRSQPTSIPVLDAPKPATKEVLAHGASNIKKLAGGGGSDDIDFTNIEDLHASCMFAALEVFQKGLKIDRDRLHLERSYLETIEDERMQEINKQASLNHKRGIWSNVEKVLLTAGLIAAGVAGIAIGAVALGSAAILVGTLLTLDHILDDAAKKAVASWMAKGDQERQDTYVMRINLFCSGVSTALALSISPAHALMYGVKVAQTAASAVKSVYEWRQNVHKGTMIGLGALASISQQEVNTMISNLQNSVKTITHHNEMTHDVEEGDNDLKRDLARSIR